MLKLNKARLFGGTCWDGDSNLRQLGVNPATLIFNRSNPFNITTQLSPEAPANGENNNPYYNPMFYPRLSTPNYKYPFLTRTENKNKLLNFLIILENIKKLGRDNQK